MSYMVKPCTFSISVTVFTNDLLYSQSLILFSGEWVILNRFMTLGNRLLPDLYRQQWLDAQLLNNWINKSTNYTVKSCNFIIGCLWWQYQQTTVNLWVLLGHMSAICLESQIHWLTTIPKDVYVTKENYWQRNKCNIKLD